MMSCRFLICLIALLMAASAIPAMATTYTVKPDGTGDFPTIQVAIDDPGVLDGDIIELINGVYAGEGNRNIDYMGKGITVRSQSGIPDSCIIDCEGGPDSLNQGFLFQSGEGPDSILEGITVANGDRTGGWGGGIRCLATSSPTLRNLKLVNNNAKYGGAMVCFDGASPTISDAIFVGNTAEFRGGAIYITTNSCPALTGLTFLQNSTNFTGGALNCDDGSDPRLRYVTFEGNSARSGGGMSASSSASPVLNEVTFLENSATWGGALICESGGYPLLTNVDFIRNTASRDGGGIRWESGGSPSLSGSVFDGNTASERGGALDIRETDLVVEDVLFVGNSSGVAGGAVYFIDVSPNFHNVTFSGNTSVRGAAMTCYSSTPMLDFVTFSGNSADQAGAIFGGDQAHYFLTNVTFYGNSTTGDGAGILCTNSSATVENSIIAFSPAGEVVSCATGGTVDLTCCDIFGNTAGDWVGCIADQFGIDGNISEDPLFCDAETGDLRLDTDSPCLSGNHPDGPGTCGLIGSHGIGCGAADVGETAVLQGEGVYLAPITPNPFTSASKIRYVIPDGIGTVHLQLMIYDAAGRLVRTLVHSSSSGGSHSVLWDGTNDTGMKVRGGVYFYQLKANGETKTRRMILVR